jgi:hypothetical protein
MCYMGEKRFVHTYDVITYQHVTNNEFLYLLTQTLH